jgi:hexokinase
VLLLLQEEQTMKQVAIPKAVYTGSCNQLFDFLAEQLADFIKEQEARHKVRGEAAAAADRCLQLWQ